MTKDPNSMFQKAGSAFLCAGVILAVALAAPRQLRVFGVFQTVGVIMFMAFAAALWPRLRAGFGSERVEDRLAALGGGLLVAPFVLMGTLWVGIGPPWEAGPGDNQLRYVVLVLMATAVTAGFIVMNEALRGTNGRVASSCGFAASVIAGPILIIGESMLLAAFSGLVRHGQIAPVFVALSEFQDILMFFGGALTYTAAAAFAVAMRQAGWIGRGASVALSAASVVGLVALVVRGLHFPDPAALSAPWYMTPGVIAGVPAVPFIVPYFIGVLAIGKGCRREPAQAAATAEMLESED